MAKKKASAGGRHVTPRMPVQLPADWFRVAQRIANQRPMPTTWLLVELIQREAERLGVDPLPPLPWADDLSAPDA